MESWNDESVRKLIRAVRLNPGLYAKGSRAYKDMEAKRLALETIAFQIDATLTGDMASKKFKYLRDSFVKESRLMSQEENRPSGSGGGAVKTHIPTEFFYDLLFLKEHIGTKRSISNIRAPVTSESLKRPLESQSPVVVRNVCPTIQNQVITLPSPMGDIPIQQITALTRQQNSDSGVETVFPAIQESTPSDSDSPIEFVYCEEREVLSDSEPTPSRIMPQSSVSVKRGGLHQSLLRSKAAAALKIPPADMRSKRKSEADEAAKALDRLNETAKAVMSQISTTNNKKDCEEDGCLGMVKYALNQLPKDKVMLCMMDFLKIATIYQKGGTPTILEN